MKEDDVMNTNKIIAMARDFAAKYKISGDKNSLSTEWQKIASIISDDTWAAADDKLSKKQLDEASYSEAVDSAIQAYCILLNNATDRCRERFLDPVTPSMERAVQLSKDVGSFLVRARSKEILPLEDFAMTGRLGEEFYVVSELIASERADKAINLAGDADVRTRVVMLRIMRDLSALIPIMESTRDKNQKLLDDGPATTIDPDEPKKTWH